MPWNLWNMQQIQTTETSQLDGFAKKVSKETPMIFWSSANEVEDARQIQRGIRRYVALSQYRDASVALALMWRESVRSIGKCCTCSILSGTLQTTWYTLSPWTQAKLPQLGIHSSSEILNAFLYKTRTQKATLEGRNKQRRKMFGKNERRGLVSKFTKHNST